MSSPKKVTASSGNVFADLGFGNPEEELFKAFRDSEEARLLPIMKAAGIKRE